MKSTKPKDKALSDRNRALLRDFARTTVLATADASRLDATYSVAAKLVRDACEKAWPKKEMAILAKHNVAKEDICIEVTGNGDYVRFEFRAGDGVVRPKLHCRSMPIIVEPIEPIVAHLQAVKNWDETQDNRLRDFVALIYGARTFNQLADAWPAVEELRAQIVGTNNALLTLNDDVRARIQSDPAFAKAA